MEQVVHLVMCQKVYLTFSWCMLTARSLVCIWPGGILPPNILCLVVCYTQQEMHRPFPFEPHQAGASSENAAYCSWKGRRKADLKFLSAQYPSRSGWFQTQPNDACVVCVQCVPRGLYFSDVVMATQFILTWFCDVEVCSQVLGLGWFFFSQN